MYPYGALSMNIEVAPCTFTNNRNNIFLVWINMLRILTLLKLKNGIIDFVNGNFLIDNRDNKPSQQ